MSSSRTLAALAGMAACALAANFVLPGAASGAVWNSAGEADWSTAANWDGGIVPSSGWAVVEGAGAPTLASGTALFAGQDFVVVNAPLTLDGGSLKMTYGAGSNVWVGWGGANSRITVNGGTLEFWQMFVGSASMPGAPNPANAGSVSVNGGDLVGQTLFITDDSTMSVSSGNVTLADVLHLRDGFLTMSGGTFSTPGIGFDGAGTILTLSGGRLNLGWGIFSASDGYVDFPGASTGVIHLAGDTAGSGAADMLVAGKVRYMGLADATAFGITTDATGSYIAAVPEPASGAAVAMALGFLARRRRQR